jgi:hypothetical protein
MMRRRLVVAAVAVALVIVALRLAITTVDPVGYRVIDDFNVAVQVIGGHPTWRAATSVEETSSTVTVGVSEMWLRLGPGFDDTISYLVVRLNDPLGTRTLVDAATGSPIPRLSP